MDSFKKHVAQRLVVEPGEIKGSERCDSSVKRGEKEKAGVSR
jgi:hypothetical protein